MDYEKLKRLNDILINQFKDYISMIAVGSIVTGDPYIEGKSDKDILLIFKDSPENHLDFIEKTLGQIQFDDSYVFTTIPRNEFGQADSKYSFSNRFRSKTLFGEDLVPLSHLPDTQTIQKTYILGLKEVILRLNIQITNSAFWSVKKIRNKFWTQFKHAFMYLAMKCYYDTNTYPITRKEIVESLQSKELSDVFRVLHSIDQQSKEELISSARQLLNYLKLSTFPQAV
jgi:hypothetical protein